MYYLFFIHDIDYASFMVFLFHKQKKCVLPSCTVLWDTLLCTVPSALDKLFDL